MSVDYRTLCGPCDLGLHEDCYGLEVCSCDCVNIAGGDHQGEPL